MQPTIRLSIPTSTTNIAEHTQQQIIARAIVVCVFSCSLFVFIWFHSIVLNYICIIIFDMLYNTVEFAFC